MTLRAQRTIVAVLVAIGTVLGFYLVDEAWSARDEMQLKTNSLERELDDKQRILANHAQVSTQLEEMREMLGMLVQQLPSRLNQAIMEKALRDQAALAGVEIISLQMDAEYIREGFYAELPTEIIAQGSSAQFLKFVDALTHEIAVRQVSALKIEPIDGTTTLRATMKLASFHYIEYEE